MKPSDIRNHISQQCGFNKAKSMDEYDPLLAAYNNGDGDQREKPTAAWIETSTACYLTGEVKPYAIQVCNAGAMPDHLPTSFEDWIKSNSDGIDDRTEATCKWFDELPKLPF